LFDAVVDQTRYAKTSQEIEVYDYNEDDQEPVEWTCEIKTYKLDENEPNTLVEIANNIIQDGYTQFQAIFTPLVPPVLGEGVNMEDVATIYDPITDPLGWIRFAHGNKYTVTTPGLNTRRIQNWFNDQADNFDTFIKTDGTTVSTKNSDLYTSTPTQILADENLGAFYGCYSTLQYEFYQIIGTMFSADGDNDVILYQIAFTVDEFGVEHTLSLAATTGGISLAQNPTYNGTDTSDIWLFNPTGDESKYNFALVYNYGKEGFQVLDGDLDGVPDVPLRYYTATAGTGWNTAGDVEFDIKRSGDEITVDVDWTVTGETSTMIYKLNDNPLTEKFKNGANIFISKLSLLNGNPLYKNS